MKQIKASYPMVRKILGEQKEKEGCSYRLTTSMVSVPFESGTLLFHTLTGSLYLLEGTETPEDLRSELTRAWFFVPEAFDEVKQSRELRDIVRALHAKDTAKTGFTILTTTDCNARCFYCYEMGRKRVPMTDQTAHDTASYIARVSGGKEVHIQWFGGEPLVNRRAIGIITNDLIKAGVPFRSEMTTNGFLFDRETILAAKTEWHLEKVQITLDGTEETYNRIKAYVTDDPNAYEKVMGNIRDLLSEGIRVRIRLNVDRSNAEDLILLASELKDRFAGQDIRVYPRLMGEFAGRIHAFDSPENAAECLIRLEEKLKESGLFSYGAIGDSYKANACMADDETHEVITPDGRIGRCEHFSETELTGSICESERDAAAEASWRQWFEPFETCKGCPAFPTCTFLQKCDWIRKGCSEADRIIRIHHLKQKAAEEYMRRTAEKRRLHSDQCPFYSASDAFQ